MKTVNVPFAAFGIFHHFWESRGWQYDTYKKIQHSQLIPLPLLLIIIFITIIIITTIIIIIIIWCSGHIRYWERRLFILLPSNTHLDYMSAAHTWNLSHNICHVQYLHDICHTWYLSDICHIWYLSEIFHIWYLHDICYIISLPIHTSIIWAPPIPDICLIFAMSDICTIFAIPDICLIFAISDIYMIFAKLLAFQYTSQLYERYPYLIFVWSFEVLPKIHPNLVS